MVVNNLIICLSFFVFSKVAIAKATAKKNTPKLHRYIIGVVFTMNTNKTLLCTYYFLPLVLTDRKKENRSKSRWDCFSGSTFRTVYYSIKIFQMLKSSSRIQMSDYYTQNDHIWQRNIKSLEHLLFECNSSNAIKRYGEWQCYRQVGILHFLLKSNLWIFLFTMNFVVVISPHEYYKIVPNKIVPNINSCWRFWLCCCPIQAGFRHGNWCGTDVWKAYNTQPNSTKY
jgi:hypothetical protein